MDQEVVDSIIANISTTLRRSLCNSTSISQTSSPSQSSLAAGSTDGQGSSTDCYTAATRSSTLKRRIDLDHENESNKKAKYRPPTLFESLRHPVGKGKGSSRSGKTPSKEKVTYYVRDIMILPPEFGNNGSGRITVPRQERRNALAEVGLVGKIEFHSGMSDVDVRREVCEVFSEPMGLTSESIKNGQFFAFTYLQKTGAGSRSLCVPSVKDTFIWTGKAVASLAKSGSIIYLLAKDDIPAWNEVCINIIHFSILFMLMPAL
jgi:hypothetical protein